MTNATISTPKASASAYNDEQQERDRRRSNTERSNGTAPEAAVRSTPAFDLKDVALNLIQIKNRPGNSELETTADVTEVPLSDLRSSVR